MDFHIMIVYSAEKPQVSPHNGNRFTESKEFNGASPNKRLDKLGLYRQWLDKIILGDG